uniref:Uncharacterized protein n=1 Tax=Rhizophora mucronata TaxID=61149 RepID=A0A2P2IWZ9_RHIMU
MSTTLPASLHRIPVHRHGLPLLPSFHDCKVGKFRLFFQFSSASTS